MAPFFFEEEMILALSVLASGIPSMLLQIATYVLSAMALYAVACRRGIARPWLAWIPVANCWILGSLSDQYQYVVKGQDKSRRKVLLVLKILSVVLSVTMTVLAVMMAAGAILANNDAQLMSNINGPLMALLGLCVPMCGISIAVAVIRYMALYDVFRSLDPANSVLFLVLSILFHVTEPFFLFFNRDKDAGMPPRKQPEPAMIPSYEAPRETWAEDGKDYL